MFSLSLPETSCMHPVTTGDGSHTLFVPHLNEHYHSTFGAMSESMHVFIQAGLGHLNKRTEISVLEVGFGTGLNALLAYRFAVERHICVTYHALEKYPLDPGLANRLNYVTFLPFDLYPAAVFADFHNAQWNMMITMHPCFHLHKIQGDLAAFKPGFGYDLIFFDAFAPDKQPEMWTQAIFDTLYRNLSAGGIITTYCVKGTVKRMLRSAGFRLERLPGPPGKREMLRGTKLLVAGYL